MGRSIARELRFFVAGGVSLAFSAALWAAGLPPSVQEGVDAFVKNHPSLSGQAYELRNPLMRGKTAECLTPLEFSASQPKLRGKINLRVRCAKPVWSALISADVVMPGDYWVAGRFLPAGTALAASDMRAANGDLAALPEDVVRFETDALGRVLNQSLPAGGVLRLNALRENAVIKAGERVRINLVGSGFLVSGTGTAVSAGSLGGAVTVKTVDGQQMTGRVVKAGLVEVVLE